MAKKERLLPTGTCWCGCNKETVGLGSFFRLGHDKAALAQVIKREYGHAADFLAAHDYQPGGSKKLSPKKEKVA